MNAGAAIQLDGVLFMEGEGEPGEIQRLRRDLRGFADDAAAAGDWLATAMQPSWAVVPQLFDIDDLADLLGERHRIISNNWQGASLMHLIRTPAQACRRTSRPRRLLARRAAC